MTRRGARCGGAAAAVAAGRRAVPSPRDSPGRPRPAPPPRARAQHPDRDAIAGRLDDPDIEPLEHAPQQASARLVGVDDQQIRKAHGSSPGLMGSEELLRARPNVSRPAVAPGAGGKPPLSSIPVTPRRAVSGSTSPDRRPTRVPRDQRRGSGGRPRRDEGHGARSPGALGDVTLFPARPLTAPDPASLREQSESRRVGRSTSIPPRLVGHSPTRRRSPASARNGASAVRMASSGSWCPREDREQRGVLPDLGTTCTRYRLISDPSNLSPRPSSLSHEDGTTADLSGYDVKARRCHGRSPRTTIRMGDSRGRLVPAEPGVDRVGGVGAGSG